MRDNRLRLADASLRLDSMPAAGREVIVRPDETERAAIAEALEITSVDALDVTLHAEKFRGGFRVTGKLVARITQPSIISLEPVTQEIAESVDRVFLPGEQKPFAGPAGAEVFVDLDGDDVPDHFEGNEADLTELIVETLALAIDLYPRAEGESLDVTGDAPEPPESPFAALKALKKD